MVQGLPEPQKFPLMTLLPQRGTEMGLTQCHQPHRLRVREGCPRLEPSKELTG